VGSGTHDGPFGKVAYQVVKTRRARIAVCTQTVHGRANGSATHDSAHAQARPRACMRARMRALHSGKQARAKGLGPRGSVGQQARWPSARPAPLKAGGRATAAQQAGCSPKRPAWPKRPPAHEPLWPRPAPAHALARRVGLQAGAAEARGPAILAVAESSGRPTLGLADQFARVLVLSQFPRAKLPNFGM
jgi:hypothetical protein